MTSAMKTTTSMPTVSSSAPTCTTAVPGEYGYVPVEACNALWAYAPSFAAAITFSVLFSLLTICHIALAFVHRKPFCWVIIMGAAWELAAFVTRALGAHNQQSIGLVYPATLFFLLAPLWINAFVYMTAGRLIWAFHPEKRVFRVKAISIGKYFVWLDILSFLVQGVGGTMMSPDAGAKTMEIGKNIYMAGMGFQELFILIFLALIVRFHVMLRRFQHDGVVLEDKRRDWLLYTLYGVLTLITMRIIFRLIEFSAGNTPSNPLPHKEVYALALDAAPMVMAVLILAIIHPGLVLKGPESEFPSRKEKKKERKERKRQKKEKKMAKKGGREVQYLSGHASNDNLIGDVELGIVGTRGDIARPSGR